MRLVGTIVLVEGRPQQWEVFETSGGYCILSGETSTVRGWNFPYINSAWRWDGIAPSATEEERVKIQQFRLLGPDAWLKLRGDK